MFTNFFRIASSKFMMGHLSMPRIVRWDSRLLHSFLLWNEKLVPMRKMQANTGALTELARTHGFVSQADSAPPVAG